MQELSYKEQSLAKYRPEDPWKRWSIPRNLPAKTLAVKADDPLKIGKNEHDKK